MSEKSIDQNIFPEVLGTAQCFLLPEANGRNYPDCTYISTKSANILKENEPHQNNDVNGSCRFLSKRKEKQI